MVTAPILPTVMAHPDDAELWAGGTIARHSRTGGTATIAVTKHDPVRASEAAAGAQILGADLYLLEELTAVAISTALTDHRRCANHVLAALPDVFITTGHPSRLYHCDGYNNLDQHGRPQHLPTIIDVTDYWPTKIAALQAHTSQPILNHFGPTAEALAHLHGTRIGSRYAEAFHPVPVLGRIPAAEGL